MTWHVVTPEGAQYSAFHAFVDVLADADWPWRESLGTRAVESPLLVRASSVAADATTRRDALILVHTLLATSVKTVAYNQLQQPRPHMIQTAFATT